METNQETVEQTTETTSTSGFLFRMPAGIQDFNDHPVKQALMTVLWNNNLNGFTQQGMLNNQWNTTNTPETTNYYNPLEDNPASTAANVQWSPFPGRLAFNYPNASQAQLNEMADTGDMNTEGDINDNPCGEGSKVPYFPYGPRGWQDEYCEWAVTRNGDGKITRIDFTCENPEYWNSLWQIDPVKVLELYQTILGKPQITLQDLSLDGVTDPITQKPAYNPLNIWNSGTESTDEKGGAIHLTSTPNTIQTEIGLATASSILRNNPSGSTGNTTWPSSEYNALLCDAQFGQKHRNSDPNIGGTVNSFVNGGNVVTLADPPGLYIQMPDFSNYTTPDNSDASEYWTIVRGSETLDTQDGTKLPGNFILHAVFEVPADKGFVVGDIQISGNTIDWGSQVASTFKMQIVASAYAGTKPAGYNAVGDRTAEDTFPQPLQLFFEDYFTKMYTTAVPNPVDHPISLLSNSTFIPPQVAAGSSAEMVLTCATCSAKSGDHTTYPTVSFGSDSITAVVTKVEENITYAVPGNSQPDDSYTALYLTVSVTSNADLGIYNVSIQDVGKDMGTAMPALLEIIHPLITVNANESWQKTGVTVGEKTVYIAYEYGAWTANPNDNSGQLYGADGDPSFIMAKEGYALPGSNEGALVGKVDGTAFLIGSAGQVPAGLTGELELCINDDLKGIYGAGLTDNEGSVTVEITVV